MVKIMNKFKKITTLGIILGLVLFIGFSAVVNSDTGDESKGQASKKEEVPLGDKKITIPHMDWVDSVASSNVMKAVLEEVGYDVDLMQVATGPMFASIADGSADAMTSAWLPTNEAKNWEKHKDEVDKVQKNTNDTPIGLTVPEYMEDIESLEDLKNNKKLGEATDWKLYAIEPGTGTTELMEKAVEEYGLDNWELVESSESAMLSVLQDKVEDHEPVIVSLWKPHYAFGQWDLRILDDPKDVYGESDDIYTLTRKSLEEDSPAAHEVLSQFKWDHDLMSEVMVNIEEGMDEEKAGEKFMEDHPDVVKEWIKNVK